MSKRYKVYEVTHVVYIEHESESFPTRNGPYFSLVVTSGDAEAAAVAVKRWDRESRKIVGFDGKAATVIVEKVRLLEGRCILANDVQKELLKG